MPSRCRDLEDNRGRAYSLRFDWPLFLMLMALVSVGYWAMKRDGKRVCRELREDEIQSFTREGKRMVRLDQLNRDECVIIRPQPQAAQDGDRLHRRSS